MDNFGNRLDIVWENLAFFLNQLRLLPTSEALNLSPSGGAFCLSTRSAFASENWVFCPEGPASADSARAALDFFGGRGLPFVWPLRDATPEALDLLRRAGLREAGRLLAMSLEVSEGGESSGLSFHCVNSREDALRWADLAWQGFDGEAPAPDNFRELADAMRDLPAVRLVTASDGGQDLGTFLLAIANRAAGVYYFAVPPTHRRRGVAMAMMREILRMAREAGAGRVVLQATPAGVPFYRAAGFETHGEIPLFSTSDDVF